MGSLRFRVYMRNRLRATMASSGKKVRPEPKPRQGLHTLRLIQ